MPLRKAQTNPFPAVQSLPHPPNFTSKCKCAVLGLSGTPHCPPPGRKELALAHVVTAVQVIEAHGVFYPPGRGNTDANSRPILDFGQPERGILYTLITSKSHRNVLSQLLSKDFQLHRVQEDACVAAQKAKRSSSASWPTGKSRSRGCTLLFAKDGRSYLVSVYDLNTS